GVDGPPRAVWGGAVPAGGRGCGAAADRGRGDDAGVGPSPGTAGAEPAGVPEPVPGGDGRADCVWEGAGPAVAGDTGAAPGGADRPLGLRAGGTGGAAAGREAR